MCAILVVTGWALFQSCRWALPLYIVAGYCSFSGKGCMLGFEIISTSFGIDISKRLCHAPEIRCGENSNSWLKCLQFLSKKQWSFGLNFTPAAFSSAFFMGLIFHNSTMHKALPAFLPTEFVFPQQITISPR